MPTDVSAPRIKPPPIPLSLACTLLVGALIVATFVLVTPVEAQDVDPRLDEAIRWYTGMTGTVDDQRARELLLEALEAPNPISRMWLARCHSRGRMFFEHDEARADQIAAEVLDEIERLAYRGVAEAAFLMGTTNDEGLAMEIDAAMAAAWFHRAADQAHVLAQHNLGNAYYGGRGLPQSDAMAVYWWHRAAEQGDAIPQRELASMYEQGRGAERDLAEAERWYRLSAEKGNAQAREALERLTSQR